MKVVRSERAATRPRDSKWERRACLRSFLLELEFGAEEKEDFTSWQVLRSKKKDKEKSAGGSGFCLLSLSHHR